MRQSAYPTQNLQFKKTEELAKINPHTDKFCPVPGGSID